VLTDGQLVERVRRGEREVFGDLVCRYRDMVYGLGYHLTMTSSGPRLAQEAFIQAYLRLGQLRDPDKFSGWLRPNRHERASWPRASQRSGDRGAGGSRGRGR